MKRSLVFLDTETTGLDQDKDQVWEIAYALEDGPVYSSLVEHSAPRLTAHTWFAFNLNGYFSRWEFPQDGAAYESRAAFEKTLRETLKGATLVCSNPRFDANMLYRRWGTEPWHHRVWDISAYAAGVFGWDELRGLADIAEVCGVKQPDHTAAQDVATLRECFRELSKVKR